MGVGVKLNFGVSDMGVGVEAALFSFPSNQGVYTMHKSVKNKIK